MNISCKDAMKHICDNLGEDNGTERCKCVKKHIEGCEHCKNYFSSVEKTIDYYKAYCPDLPDECHKRLMDFLKLEE